MAVVTGSPGTGKTTLLARLGEHLNRQSIEFAFLLDPRLPAPDFYDFLAYDLNLDCASRAKSAVMRALRELLSRQEARGSTAALVIDDAHRLEWEVWEEILDLDQLQNRAGRLLQTILCGSPELDRLLDSEELRRVKERIGVRCRLKELGVEETAECICRRMADCGMPDQTVFPPEILGGIYVRSGGVLRVAGALCDGLLACGAERGQRVVTPDMLDEVWEKLQTAQSAAAAGAGGAP